MNWVASSSPKVFCWQKMLFVAVALSCSEEVEINGQNTCLNELVAKQVGVMVCLWGVAKYGWHNRSQERCRLVYNHPVHLSSVRMMFAIEWDPTIQLSVEKRGWVCVFVFIGCLLVVCLRGADLVFVSVFFCWWRSTWNKSNRNQHRACPTISSSIYSPIVSSWSRTSSSISSKHILSRRGNPSCEMIVLKLSSFLQRLWSTTFSNRSVVMTRRCHFLMMSVYSHQSNVCHFGLTWWSCSSKRQRPLTAWRTHPSTPYKSFSTLDFTNVFHSLRFVPNRHTKNHSQFRVSNPTPPYPTSSQCHWPERTEIAHQPTRCNRSHQSKYFESHLAPRRHLRRYFRVWRRGERCYLPSRFEESQRLLGEVSTPLPAGQVLVGPNTRTTTQKN